MLTDFDGTLSLVVDDPLAAVPLPRAVDVLERLAVRYARVAVVSGRPVAYLASHLGPGPELSGLYGLERMVAGEVVADPEADRWRPVVAEAVAAAAAAFPDHLVEPKGLALTVHFRTAPELASAMASWAADEGRRTGLVVRPAKASIELHPPVAADKGTVVAELAAGLDAVCFLGDDVGDLPAFAALDQLAADGVHAVKVAVRTEESPPEVLARADVVVDGPTGALAVLEALAEG